MCLHIVFHPNSRIQPLDSSDRKHDTGEQRSTAAHGITTDGTIAKAFRCAGGLGWVQEKRISQATDLFLIEEPRFCEEHSQTDVCPGSFDGTDESFGRTPGGVDVIDNQQAFTSEKIGIDFKKMLDVGGKFVFTCDVRPFAVAHHRYVIETIDCPGLLAKQLGEPLPSTNVRVLCARRYTYNHSVGEI